MVTGGRMEDGTPFVAIGAGEPESREFIVHSECPECGRQHYFDLWRCLAGEPIECEHCGRTEISGSSRLNNETGEMEVIRHRMVLNRETGEFEEVDG